VPVSGGAWSLQHFTYNDAVAAYAASAISAEAALLLNFSASSLATLGDATRMIFANALPKITPGVEISGELSKVRRNRSE
jgi:hypothetical protein